VIVVLGSGGAGHGPAGGDDPARALARGLRRQGASVVVGALDDAPGSSESSRRRGEERTLRCTMASGDEVAALLGRAEEGAGPLDAVVLVSAGPESASRGALAELDAGEWVARVEVPLERTVACFQGSYRALRARRGCLVVLVPSFSLVGSAGWAPWAAVAEGQRALAKAAARAWGAEKISVNCVAVPGALLASSVGGDDDTDRPGQPPASLAVGPDLESGVAPVVASLITGGWTAVTGATIAVDGGVWMTP
jgi:NAD(P)-dependent dehydrogenase (short-subunit alcohol dehydrogenase family)